MATLVKIGSQLSLNKTRTCAFLTANSLRNATSKSPKDNPIRKFNQQQKEGGFWKKFDGFFAVKEEKFQSSKERNRTTMMYVASAVIVTVGATYAAVPLYRIFCQVCNSAHPRREIPVKFIYSEKATKFCDISTSDLSYVKVSKSQKHFFLKFHCPKNEQNIRQNSALESKKWSIQKDKGPLLC